MAALLSQRMTIIGVGLIGGSLARALRDKGACAEIVGCGRDENNLRKAVDLGVIDRYELDPAGAVDGADLVILAVPLGAVRRLMTQIRDRLPAQAVVMDVGSAKGCVVDDARQALPEHLPWFVPAHPIAGTEKSGVEASLTELFVDHNVILTPLAETREEALQRAEAIWTAAGARILTMAVEHHDRLLAATSHLPHLLAFSVIAYLADRVGPEAFSCAAGGLRDLTRIASSDPRMWTDICLANGTAIRQALADYRQGLDEIDRLLAAADEVGLMQRFATAKATRDQYWSAQPSEEGPDVGKRSS